MGCNCDNRKDVKPDEACGKCIHKHLAAAFAMTDLTIGGALSRRMTLRIAAQVYLATMHMRGDAASYVDFIKVCASTMAAALHGKQYIKALESLAEAAWLRLNGNQYELPAPSSDSLDDDLVHVVELRIAAAIELMKFEPTHEPLNLSSAIGELVMAGWALMKVDQKLAAKCRSLYHSIEDSAADFSGAEELLKDVMALEEK